MQIERVGSTQVQEQDNNNHANLDNSVDSKDTQEPNDKAQLDASWQIVDKQYTKPNNEVGSAELEC